MKLFAKITFWILILISIVALAVFFAVFYYARNLPDPIRAGSREIVQSTKLYDRTGSVLLFEIHGEERRTIIPFEEIPEYARLATLAIEDDAFYRHPAFDWRAIMRAFTIDIIKGRVEQGGSTITQQLVKNAFLSPKKTLSRKIKELILAVQLERRYTKDEILSLYLNQVPYGSNAYGIEAASQTFFNIPARDLTLAQAALLASLPRRPSYYSPHGSHADELRARQEFILERMYALGLIDEQERETAKKETVVFAPPARGIRAPHFVMMVREYLNDTYGEEFIERAGFKVITTLNWDYQQRAEQAIQDGVARNTQLYQGTNAALVAQEATTGDILALVGSADYFNVENDGNFNVAARGLRQPGSAFKPFAYLTAFKKGYTLDTVLFDVSTEFDTTENPERSYRPENYDGVFRGPVTMRDALAQSINIPAVKTLYLAGIENTIETARALGITTLTDPRRYGLTLVLGGGEVTLMDMVGAYSVFAKEGVMRAQQLVRRIEDANGNVIEEDKNVPRTVYDAQYIRMINAVLSDPNARAPLFKTDPFVFDGYDVAAKTGTTNDFRDAWTIGYTPTLVVGVWAGNNDNTPMNKGGLSILAAAPIWNSFMKEVLPSQPREVFNKPDVPPTSKPVLNGTHIVEYRLGSSTYPHVHNILFYVDRNDPRGNSPTDPSQDPQFLNWESPVITWARAAIPDFDAAYNKPLPADFTKIQNGEYAPRVTIHTPANGDFVGASTEIHANIEALLGIYTVRTFVNNEMVDETAVSSRRDNANDPQNIERVTTYEYRTRVSVPGDNLQNTLRIEVTDALGNIARATRILYR